jgi:hypothetical protein
MFVAEFVTVDPTGDVYATVLPPLVSCGHYPCTQPTGPAGLNRIFPDGTTTVVSSFESKVVFDPQGNYYAAATDQVYQVSPSGVQTPVAGSITPGGLALDVAANLYLTNNVNNSIEEVVLNPAAGRFQLGLPDRRYPPKPGPSRTD